jgi:ABC-type multidrug transport system permease subunit
MNILYGFLVLGVIILTVVSFVTYKRFRKGKLILLSTWLLITILILVLSLIDTHALRNEFSEGGYVVFWYLLCLLNFPSSILIGILIESMTQSTVMASGQRIILYCISVSFFGYVQWFVILPRIIQLIKNKS